MCVCREYQECDDNHGDVDQYDAVQSSRIMYVVCRYAGLCYTHSQECQECDGPVPEPGMMMQYIHRSKDTSPYTIHSSYRVFNYEGP